MLQNYDDAYMFKDGPGALMELKIDDDDIETQPPEFLRHFLKTLKGDSDNQVDKMSKNADKLMPWSHDVWFMGITLLEIINCMPVNQHEKSKVLTSKKRMVLMQGMLGQRKMVNLEDKDDTVI